jgi:Zn finger protein HypA/HybF involved in hydrogenase expression
MPTNPFEDVKNVKISHFLAGSKATAFPDDSIEIGIIVNIPRLVKSMKSIDGEDNNERVLSFKNASSIKHDTVFFKTLYKTPGNKSVTIKAVLIDNTNYDYPFEIPVIMPPMKVIFDTVPPKDTTVFNAKATVLRIAAHTLPSTTINYALSSSPAMADSCFRVDGTGCASLSINPPISGVYGLKIVASNEMVKDSIIVTMYVNAAPVITVKSSNGETRIGVVDTLTFTGPENDSLSLDSSGNFQSDEVKVIATGLKNVIKVEFTPKESKTYSFALRVKGVITDKYRYNDIVFANHPVAGNQTSIWKQDTITISTPENKMATQSIESLLKNLKLTDVWLRCEKGTIIDGIWRDNIPWGARPVDTVIVIATYNNREYPLKIFIRVSASDGTEPKIVLVNPVTPDATVSSNTIACKFIITDAHSGVGGVVFRKGTTILSDTLHSGDTYQCIVTGLVKGEKTIVTVEATDSSQKKNTASMSFALTYNPDIEDNVGPVISLKHPLVASFSVPTAEATIQLQCTDQSKIKSVTAKKGNVTQTVQKADPVYTIVVTGLNAGKIDTVIVTATDSSSNQNISTFPIFVMYEPSMRDTKGPSIRLVAPLINNDTVDQPSVVMKVISIDESKIASVRFKLGAVSGVMNKLDDTTFAMIVSGLVTGKNQITISAKDASLNCNVSDSVFTFSYDRTHNDSVKPAINCKQAVRDTLIVSSLPSKLDVTCTDASGIKSVVCKKGTSALTVTPGSGNVYSVDLKTLTTGVVDTFNFTVTDNATKSNTATKSIFVIYDLVHKFDTTYYKKNFTISGINWDFRNTPSDYDTSYRLSFDVNIRYSGVSLAYNQIDTVKLEGGGLIWNLKYDSSAVNESSKNLLYKNYYSYNTKTLSTNGFILPVDTFKIHTYFKNREVVTRSVIAPIPGSQTASGYTHVYTEDFTGAVTAKYHKALARPVGISAKKGVDTMIVSFTINDTSAYNGSIEFFDTTNVSVVNSTKLFRDYNSKKITTYINNGKGLYTDGKQTNTVKIPVSELNLKSGKTVSNISYARITVTDGSQFANVSTGTYRESYSYTSISSKVKVQ